MTDMRPDYTVVGATGFIGGRLEADLRAAGHTVYAPARAPDALFGRELGKVFYCAGMTADYASRPFETVEAHVGLLARLLREGRFERLVYLSSTRLYDGELAGSAAEGEDLRLNPANPRHLFDLSKALGEHLCLTASGGRASVARLSCVYGWEPGASGFLSEWLRRAAREKSFRLDSASGLVRDYILLDDAVAALRAMLDLDVQGVVNVASGENVSNGELLAVFAACGWSVELARASARQNALVSDVRRLHGLGVRPRPVLGVVEAFLKSLPDGIA